MLIDLSKLLLHEGKVDKLAVDIEMDSIDTGTGSYRIVDKEPVHLTLSNIGKKMILMEASINLALLMPCDRCLENVKTDFNLNITKEIDMKESDSDRQKRLDEMNFIESALLDMEKFVYNEMIIELPMKVLCNTDCRGICNKCGENLNLHTCDCESTELDPRMSKVLDLFNQCKEV